MDGVITQDGEGSATIPAHVPPDRVFDIDIYGTPGAEKDFHLALQSIRERNLPDVFWTPRYSGHWVVTRHADVLRVFFRFRELLVARPGCTVRAGAADFPVADLYRHAGALGLPVGNREHVLATIGQ